MRSCRPAAPPPLDSTQARWTQRRLSGWRLNGAELHRWVGATATASSMQHFTGLPLCRSGLQLEPARPHSCPPLPFGGAQTSRACRRAREWPRYRPKFGPSCKFLVRLLQSALWVVEGPVFHGIPVHMWQQYQEKRSCRPGRNRRGVPSNYHFGPTVPDLMTGLGAIERAGGQNSR